MAASVNNLKLCHPCPRRECPFTPPLIRCTLSGRGIIDHAIADYCPEKRFGTDAKPATWDDTPPAKIPSAAENPATHGPGSLIETILTQMGWHGSMNCGCAAFREKMNGWGWAGCLVNLPEIIAWFAAKAIEQGLTFDARSVRKIIARAWRSEQYRKPPM